MLVVDASVVVQALLPAKGSGGEAVKRLAAQRQLHAPQLIDLEVASALRGLTRAGRIEAGRARGALEDFLDLPIARYPHAPLLTRIWALRDNLTPYDAAYAALAEALDAPLLTADKRLASVAAATTSVELAD